MVLSVLGYYASKEKHNKRHSKIGMSDKGGENNENGNNSPPIRYTTLSGILHTGGSILDDISLADESTIIKVYDSSIRSYDTTIYQYSTMESFVPYTFPDTFVMKKNEELTAMSFDDLKAYNVALQANISSYTSTIRASQVVKARYMVYKQNIQSTINQLDGDVTKNTIQLGRVRGAKANLQTVSTNYVSTLISYTSQINYYAPISTLAKSTMVGYTNTSAKLASSINVYNSTYASTLNSYSTISSFYKKYSDQYTNQYGVMMSTSTAYDRAVIQKGIKYSTLISTNIGLNSTSTYLSSLYNTSNAIQSTLYRHRIDEQAAITLRASTMGAVEYYSSLYVAALAKRNYNVALSTQISTFGNYTAALSTYNGIQYIYNMSGGGGAGQGGGTPTSLVAAALSLAARQLSSAIIAESIAESTLSTFETVATRQAGDVYNTMIQAYNRNVAAQQMKVRTFNSYRLSSLQRVVELSTIYDTNTEIMRSSISSVAYYSSLYVSSIAGKSTLQSLYSTNNTTILNKMSTSSGYSRIISSLTTDYSTYNSSYIGWKNISSLLNASIMQYINNISSYSTLYDSTVKGLSTVQSSISGLTPTVRTNRDIIFQQSSILLKDYILLEGYQNDILMNATTQEIAGYKYRETFTRTKLLTYKQRYQDLVLGAIQQSSTLNGSTVAGLMNSVEAGTYVADTTFPVQLDTPVINTAYNNITTINSFLDVFSQIYDAYNTKYNHIMNISTSVGNEMAAYDAFTPIHIAAYAAPSDPVLQQNKATKLALFIQAQQDVAQKKGIVVNDTNNIKNTLSTLFLSTYKNTFSQTEILVQESTISSFIITGLSTAAAAYYATNGIRISF